MNESDVRLFVISTTQLPDTSEIVYADPALTLRRFFGIEI